MFPDALRDIVLFLPFQAICNSPIDILLNPQYDIKKIGVILLVQLGWAVILNYVSKWFFNVSVKKITVNGG